MRLGVCDDLRDDLELDSGACRVSGFEDDNFVGFMVRNIGSSVAVTCLIGMSALINAGLLETPCRVLLCYRLWEHRLVVNFKQRDIFHRATQYKIFAMLGAAVYYVVFGSWVLQVRQGFYMVFLQSIATLSWMIYSHVNPDGQLFYITGALRQQKRLLESKRSDVEAAKKADKQENARIMPRVGECCQGLVVVDEVSVKYDIFALHARRQELAERATTAMRTKTMTPLNRRCIHEEQEWLKKLLTWVGRMGNTKALLGTKVKRSDHGDYGSAFYNLYDDQLWHKCGSFAKDPNVVEASHSRGKFLVTCQLLHILFALAVFAYQLVRSVTKSYKS